MKYQNNNYNTPISRYNREDGTQVALGFYANGSLYLINKEDKEEINFSKLERKANKKPVVKKETKSKKPISQRFRKVVMA